MKLLFNAIIKFVLGFVFIGLFLFWPAGTINYPNGWLFIGLLFVPVLIIGIILFIKDKELLRKRLNHKEKEKTQKGVVLFSLIIFISGFIISTLDFRYSWSNVNNYLVIIASVLFLIGYVLYAIVMKQNAYLSRTIEVQENQKVIDNGLYGIVRHPMYFATLLMFIPIPLILGSFWGLIPFSLYLVVIVIRIINEEKVLTLNLCGYSEYKKKVKYRLIYFIW